MQCVEISGFGAYGVADDTVLDPPDGDVTFDSSTGINTGAAQLAAQIPLLVGAVAHLETAPSFSQESGARRRAARDATTRPTQLI